MPKEIERKFLVDPVKLPTLESPYNIVQGYLPGCSSATVRVRIRNKTAFLTLKGRTKGLTRSEFEYPIPLSDAEHILSELCSGTLIEKKRYHLSYEGHLWEIDIFEGENRGLIIAEIELKDESEPFSVPPWITKEVSYDPRYHNSNLLKNAYRNW